MTKEKFDYFQKREKLSLALLKSHSQSERLKPNVADICISYQTFIFIVSCDFIIDFLANSYFIVQIHHAKTFKMKYSMSLYLNFSLEYS